MCKPLKYRQVLCIDILVINSYHTRSRLGVSITSCINSSLLSMRCLFIHLVRRSNPAALATALNLLRSPFNPTAQNHNVCCKNSIKPNIVASRNLIFNVFWNRNTTIAKCPNLEGKRILRLILRILRGTCLGIT